MDERRPQSGEGRLNPGTRAPATRLAERLEELAGVPRDWAVVTDASKAHAIAMAYVRVFRYKGWLYGDHRLRPDPDLLTNTMTLYADISRKVGRLRRMLRHPEEVGYDAIIETLADLGVYSIIGLLLVEQLEKDHASTDHGS